MMTPEDRKKLEEGRDACRSYIDKLAVIYKKVNELETVIENLKEEIGYDWDHAWEVDAYIAEKAWEYDDYEEFLDWRAEKEERESEKYNIHKKAPDSVEEEPF